VVLPDVPTALTIRPAALGDVASIEVVVAAAYTPYVARIGVRPLPLDDDYAARVADGNTHVAVDDDAVVGVLVLVPKDDHVLVHNVAVHPSVQRRGVGRALLAFAEDVARNAGHGELRLYTHEKMVENRRLYARLGYADVGRETIEGRNAVRMRKRLS
jgi:GNAT superfamily N-acetyltransferase